MQRGVIQHFDLIIAIALLQMLCIIVQMPHVRCGGAGPGHAGLQVTVDLMFRDEGFDQFLRLFAHLPQLGGMVFAQHLFEPILLDPLARA